jgi:hypothetical protein
MGWICCGTLAMDYLLCAFSLPGGRAEKNFDFLDVVENRANIILGIL